MKPLARALVLLVAGMLVAGSVYAVGPAYEGPMGNPEEPALRPYKWMWRGVKALAYHPVVALGSGNRKTPGLGMVDVFRGLRVGAVEFNESLVKGILCSEPPEAGDYKNIGNANAFLAEDVLFRNLADLGTAGAVFSSAAGAAAIWLGQKMVDHHPVHSVEYQEKLKKNEQMLRDARKRSRTEPATGAEQGGTPPPGKDADASTATRIPHEPRPLDRHTGNLLKLGR